MTYRVTTMVQFGRVENFSTLEEAVAFAERMKREVGVSCEIHKIEKVWSNV